MKTFLIVLLAIVVAHAYEPCDRISSNRSQSLAKATCGDANKVPGCFTTHRNYIGSTPVHAPILFDQIPTFDFITHVEFNCPWEDEAIFHEEVVAHHASNTTHYFQTISESWMEVKNETMRVYNIHTNASCTWHTSNTSRQLNPEVPFHWAMVGMNSF